MSDGTKTNLFYQIISEINECYRFRYIVYSYVETNLKLRYRRSLLGFIWTILAPMLHYILMGLVFTLLMGQKRPDYFTYYFSGALFFSLIAGILNRSIGVFIGNEHFIKKIYVPKLIFVLNSVAIEIANFFLAGSALIVLGLLSGHFHFGWPIFASVVPVLLLGFALFGLACIIGVLSVYFRDFVHIIPVLIQALFFVSPVIYDESMIPEKYIWLVKFNPFYYYLELFRDPLIEGGLGSPKAYLVCFTFSVCCLILGLVIVKKFENRLVFKL